MQKVEEKVHLRHCNQGEYIESCKYGDEDCPALKASEKCVQDMNDLLNSTLSKLKAIRCADACLGCSEKTVLLQGFIDARKIRAISNKQLVEIIYSIMLDDGIVDKKKEINEILDYEFPEV